MTHLPVGEVDYIVEKKGSSCGSGESGAQKLTPICKRCFAARTNVQTLATDVFQKDATHLGAIIS